MKTLLFLAVCLLTAPPLPADNLVLATRGEAAEYTLVIPAQASPSQRYAAEELQSFTEQMTGVVLPITTDEDPLPPKAVLLGATRYTQDLLQAPIDLSVLGDDGFQLKTSPPYLLILGGPVRGTLYGVYEVLERLGGCRWYTSWHQVVPQHDKWTVPPLDETQLPAFAMREPFWFDMFDGALAARNKANGNSMRLGAQHGGKIRFGSGLFVHTFNRLCPPDEFFETHPEYFSELKGRRVKDHSQLCLTNPDVLKIVTERLLAHIRKDPEARLFSVSQNDWRNFCTCADCKVIDEREGSPAGTMIAFVNQVAEAVEKEFPEVWIETLAYQYTRKPPATVRPRHNVVPRLCTIECDFSQPLDQSTYAQNQTFVEEIQAWSGMTDKLYIWDYTTNFRDYIGTFPNVLALQENVKLFRDNKVVGLFEQGAYQGRHGDFAELKAWLLAKWLWNPELPLEPLLGDFFAGYYGDAAPLVRTYFDEIHAFVQGPDIRLRIWEDVSTLPLPEDWLIRALELWRKAEAAVQDDPAQLYNVRMGAIPVMYARLKRLPPHAEIKVWLTRRPEDYAVPKEHQTLATELLARFKEAKNIRLSENAQFHQDILARWEFLAHSAPPPVETVLNKVIIEDSALALNRRGTWGDTVSDPLAADGSAMKLYNTHYEWCTTLRFNQVAFDPGVSYKIRMRARVEQAPGQSGEAFWAGVYDSVNKNSRGFLARQTTEVNEDYTWYDVAEWIPERDHYFWVGPGRFDKEAGAPSSITAFYIDQLELIRIE